MAAIALINTKSNYRGLNGKFIEVKEIAGTRVTCIVQDEQGRDVICDFTNREAQVYVLAKPFDKSRV